MSVSLISVHSPTLDLEYNFHNLNGLMHCESTYKAMKYLNNKPLPFLISRSTVPGSQKYA